jgi:hypothetical protein
MERAQYFRAQAERCLRLANQITDKPMAESLRAAAAEYHARAIEADGQATLKDKG